jgi:membrane-associated phospholipid phosphatase
MQLSLTSFDKYTETLYYIIKPFHQGRDFDNIRMRHPLLAAGLLLILATVYLRYHYLVDIIAGAGLSVLCLATSKKMYNAFGNTN